VTTPALRIRVDSAAAVPAQLRAYAEYRVFAALAPHAPAIRQVHVRLQVGTAPSGFARCDVTVKLEASGARRTTASGAPLRGAIDEAADRAAAAIAASHRRARGTREAVPKPATHSS
jgi:hypothetical protein